MKGITRIFGACAVLAMLVLAARAFTGEDAAPKPADAQSNPDAVALLDVKFLFERLPHFREKMREFERAEEKARLDLLAEEQRIARLVGQLKHVDLRDPSYHELEKEIAMARAVLAARSELQRKESNRRLAALRLGVYNEIRNEVAEYARTNGIRVVGNFTCIPDDPHDLERVNDYVGQPFAWCAGSHDITPIILNRLKARIAKKAEEEAKKTEEPPK